MQIKNVNYGNLPMGQLSPVTCHTQTSQYAKKRKKIGLLGKEIPVRSGGGRLGARQTVMFLSLQLDNVVPSLFALS